MTTDGVVDSGTADDIFEGSETTSLMIISFSGLGSKLLNNNPNCTKHKGMYKETPTTIARVGTANSRL